MSNGSYVGSEPAPGGAVRVNRNGWGQALAEARVRRLVHSGVHRYAWALGPKGMRPGRLGVPGQHYPKGVDEEPYVTWVEDINTGGQM